MSEANGTRCCALCKSPYGHVAAAGRCCHPLTAEELRDGLRAAQAAAGPREETGR